MTAIPQLVDAICGFRGFHRLAVDPNPDLECP